MAVTGSHPTFQAQPARRKQGDLLLTGRGGYLDDIELPRMHHAAILRSTEPHARIVSIDTAAAKRMPGVRHVMTGTEALEHVGVLPHFFDPAVVGARTTEFRCLAIDRVTHEGEAVALVVAQTLAQAEAARDAISVSYEPLPAVIDTERALDADAPLVYPDWGTNELCDVPFTEGDPDAKFADAPHTLAGRLTIQRYNTAPMEPRGYIASWGPDDRLTLYASTQNPHPLRSHLARTLNLSESRIRVVATRLGGGFGHKFHGYPEDGMRAQPHHRRSGQMGARDAVRPDRMPPRRLHVVPTSASRHTGGSRLIEIAAGSPMIQLGAAGMTELRRNRRQTPSSARGSRSRDPDGGPLARLR